MADEEQFPTGSRRGGQWARAAVFISVQAEEDGNNPQGDVNVYPPHPFFWFLRGRGCPNLLQRAPDLVE